MANALVVRGQKAPLSQNIIRAAQYVRMSTDYQRYSIENQAAVIAAYAQIHGLIIVRTYRDEGESGLKLKNRAGLIELLDDAQSGHADFRHILVYDVSRWGRFQDTDESAHYEYICKKAGIKVAYCAEQFDNNGTMLSSIMKNLKRVMAAEYSRELSAKVHAGACRYSQLGFRTSGEVGYGLRRQLVDEKLQQKAVLKKGDRKYLITDHVRVSPGTADEVAVVRWIFAQFLRQKSETAIARELNRKGTPTNTGRPWNRALIGRILRNENYIGNLLYNRSSRKLGEKRTFNPPTLWIRSDGCIEPIIEREVFWRAQKIIKERRVSLSEGEMLKRLRLTLKKKGKLSPKIIDETIGLPCKTIYMQRFGSLRKAYQLIGYVSKRDCEYLESRQGWAEVNAKLAAELSAEIRKTGGYAHPHGDCLRLSGTVGVNFRVARWCRGKQANHVSHWSVQRRARLLPGWIVAVRLDERNKGLLDYLLLPTSIMTRATVRFSENVRARRGIDCFEAFPILVRSLIRRLTRPSRVSPAKPSPPKKKLRSSQSKRVIGRERR
jgi:DNA invertase Pin-like site-specific DNA recombinase